MAETPDHQRLSYPLPSYNFRVTVGGQTMSFAEVSGIAVEYDSVGYRHGLSFFEGGILQTFHYGSPVAVTLKRGTILGSQPHFLFQWLTKRDDRLLTVDLCDETGTAVISWKIKKAVPVKLEAPTFDAAANEVAIESLELKARGISLEAAPGSTP